MFRKAAVLVLAVCIGFTGWSCSDQLVDSSVEPEFAKGGIPGKGATDQFVITDFRVEKLEVGEFTPGRPASDDPDINAAILQEEIDNESIGSSFFGCPDPLRTCNRITLSFEGPLEAFRFNVAHDAHQQFSSSDSYLEDPTLAANWWQSALPVLPTSGKSSPLVVYWQGQRSTLHHYDSELKQYFYTWSLMPDLDGVGINDDRFVFSCAFSTPSGGLMCGRGKLWGFEEGWAEYFGATSTERAYVVFDEIELITEGGSPNPKKKAAPPSTYLYFEVQAFAATAPFDEPPDYFEVSTQEASLATGFRPIITDPNNRMYPAGILSSGSSPDSPTKPGIEKQRYGFGPFTEEGCHEVTLLGAYIHDVDALTTVWDPNLDTGKAAKSIWVNFSPTDPASSTVRQGDGCLPLGG